MIQFFYEDVDFAISNENFTSRWISGIIENEGNSTSELNFILCTDEYLLSLNRKYLNHDYYTDILTFDHRENKTGPLTGDIYISLDRVRENAGVNNVNTNTELHRVIIHGVLHLLGYSDHTAEEQASMRKKEDACLSLLR